MVKDLLSILINTVASEFLFSIDLRIFYKYRNQKNVKVIIYTSN